MHYLKIHFHYYFNAQSQWNYILASSTGGRCTIGKYIIFSNYFCYSHAEFRTCNLLCFWVHKVLFLIIHNRPGKVGENLGLEETYAVRGMKYKSRQNIPHPSRKAPERVIQTIRRRARNFNRAQIMFWTRLAGLVKSSTAQRHRRDQYGVPWNKIPEPGRQ